MKKKSVLFILLLSQYLVNAQNDTILKMFRTVYIEKSNKIVMQSNIDKLADITRKLGNNYYSLKKGTFQVADSMAVEVNSKKQILGIIASYDYRPNYSNDTAYIHEQRKYRQIISQGREFIYSSKEQTARVTKWANETTTFELIEIITNGKRETYSVIFDIELNYQKYKNIIDIKKNDISLELFKRLGLK